MTYQRTDAGKRLVENALTKMIVWYTDGNSRTWHSRDQLRANSLPNRDVGINRLKKYAYSVKSKVITAEIYDLQTGEMIFKFKDGIWT